MATRKPKAARGAAFERKLETFLADHADGWHHGDWHGLLNELHEAGYDVADQDAVGAALEKTRLRRHLASRPVKGLGPKRIQAVADRYMTLWNLRHAPLEDLLRVPGMQRRIAEELHRTVS